MNKKEKIEYLIELKDALSPFNDQMTEAGIMSYCLRGYGCIPQEFSVEPQPKVETILKEHCFPTELETVIELFELFIEKESKDENGIIFTPKYIVDYMIKFGLRNLNRWDENITIMDPGCGCGTFLVAAVEYLYNHFQVNVDNILENNIYGIDIEPCNVRRCKFVLTLLSARYGGHCDVEKLHIQCLDSLKTDWLLEGKPKSFDYIFGNPPYVNPHDMTKETASFLRSTFMTTKSGTFNIFYAFIEQAMKFLSHRGKLIFIVPNNFLSIKSAAGLRSYLQENQFVDTILDFGENMVFRPVRTYNCILILNKDTARKEFDYCVLDRTDDLEKVLPFIRFNTMPTDRLNSSGWNLVEKRTHTNLMKIENQPIQMKEFIRTGIATLCDHIYFVDHDAKGYFKESSRGRIYLEPELIKPIYKVSDLKLHDNLSAARRYIIFPYMKQGEGFVPIPEDELYRRYPKIYNYLCSQRTELDKRDKGKKNALCWYAYGRTQGLNRYGKKLLYPTFSAHPNFTYINDEDALFCNGYAVFENAMFDMRVLYKLLNSGIMDYYVRNTSYMIEGGYFCYQKKYIEKFSLPEFSCDEIEWIKEAETGKLNEFLIRKYTLDI